MSNMGMGSIIVNYYRKLHPKDEHIPKVRHCATPRTAFEC